MKRDQLKSLLLGAILLAGITLPAKAQIGEQRHNFAIGINGGANYSTVSFQPTIKQNGLLGITGGVTARYISEKYFAMICGAQLELNFSCLHVCPEERSECYFPDIMGIMPAVNFDYSELAGGPCDWTR